MTVPSQQTVPVQLHQADDRLVLATPLPGLEPQDIAVAISGDRLTIRGAYRGSRQEQPETLVSEWTMGPYYRDITLPQPVNGVLTNATYGNGVLVLSMPTLAPGQQGAIQSSDSGDYRRQRSSALAIQGQIYSRR